MSQKFKKLQNQNDDSAAFGKWFATAVYDQHFITTEELAEFIQTQASVKKSDIKAVLDELGGALKHFFELGQKVKLDGIGIFKVGFSSIGTDKKEDCGAQNITTRRVLFQPETERVVVGQEKKDGKVKQKFVVVKTLVKDVVFEETYDTSLKPENENSDSQSGGNGGTQSGDSQNGGNSGSQNGGTQSGGSQASTLAAPTISGTTPFAETTSVSISGPDGAEIHYTTDGSTPTAESTLYSEAFTLSDTTTVKAIAIKDGESSEVASKLFTKGEGGDEMDQN
jgi:predicted histone-like DNA-binding protein